MRFNFNYDTSTEHLCVCIQNNLKPSFVFGLLSFCSVFGHPGWLDRFTRFIDIPHIATITHLLQREYYIPGIHKWGLI